MSEDGQEGTGSRARTAARASRGVPAAPVRATARHPPFAKSSGRRRGRRRSSPSPAPCSGPCRTIAARRRRRSSTAPITARPRTALRACRATMPAFPAPRPRSGRRCPAISAVRCSTPAPRRTPSFPWRLPSIRKRSAARRRSRRRGSAACSPRPISASCQFRRRRLPCRRTPTRRPVRPRNPRPTPRSPRAARIESSPSSTPRSIAAPRAPIGWQRRPRPLSCRRARSFPAR